jgi:BASS family bile acid:Na+ symporter
MLRRYLIIWLVLSSLAAFYWPHWFPGAPDVFAKSASLLSALITVTMFAIGWMLPHDEVRQLGRRWPTVLGGTAIQYVTMPTLAYFIGHLWGLSGDYLIGIVMVGSVPGAMASNVLTFNAGGNTSYSVSLTTSATLLSPLVVPIVLGLALHGEKSVDVWLLADDASRKLLLTVVIPVVLGHLLSRRFPRWAPTGRRLGSIVANLAILWIIAVVVALNRDRLSPSGSEVPLESLLLALLMVNVGGYFAGYFGSVALRLPEPMRRALTLEIGMQNAGLGAFLAKELFEHRDAIAIAPAMYTFGCMLTGTILATVWARFERRASSATDDRNVPPA